MEIVIHCYRNVFGLEAGDPALQSLEDRLAQKPMVKVPTVTIDGATDPLKPGGTAEHSSFRCWVEMTSTHASPSRSAFLNIAEKIWDFHSDSA